VHGCSQRCSETKTQTGANADVFFVHKVFLLFAVRCRLTSRTQPRRADDVLRPAVRDGIPKVLARENFRSPGPAGCTPSGPLKVPTCLATASERRRMPFIGIACSDLLAFILLFLRRIHNNRKVFESHICRKNHYRPYTGLNLRYYHPSNLFSS
jgi:hypothetical protein